MNCGFGPRRAIFARSVEGIRSPIHDATTNPRTTTGQKAANARAISWEPYALGLATTLLAYHPPAAPYHIIVAIGPPDSLLNLAAMRSLKFHQVDVFTERPLYGNPLAVYIDADDLAPELMQRIAREMNLSETTFVQRSSDLACAFRVRIFTPGIELPFAGHPTVGTAFVLTREGIIADAEFRFEMNVGPVRVRREREMFWIVPPVPNAEREVSAPDVAAAVGLSRGSCRSAYIIKNGVRFLSVIVENRQAVDSVEPNRQALQQQGLGDIDVLVFCYRSGRAYSRMFPNPAYGIVEDPATGGSVAPLSLTLKLAKELDPNTDRLTIEQGTKMGRQSFLHARFRQSDDGLHEIEAGGTAVHNFESALRI